MKNGLDNLKQRFAQQLAVSLRSAYGGTLPSLSTIARDLSLRFPYLPHVSTETVRKWLRGAAIPQSPRMQALATWLGDDLLQVLNTKQQTMNRSHHQLSHFPGQGDANPADCGTLANLVNLLNLLSESDQALVAQLVESLATKSDNPFTGELGHRLPDSNQAANKR